MSLWDVHYPAIAEIFIAGVEAESAQEAIAIAMRGHNRDAWGHIASMTSAYNYRNPAEIPSWMMQATFAEPHDPEVDADA